MLTLVCMAGALLAWKIGDRNGDTSRVRTTRHRELNISAVTPSGERVGGFGNTATSVVAASRRTYTILRSTLHRHDNLYRDPV